MHDHRQAGDFGERLARQSGRGHAGRDENEDIGHLWKPGVVIRVASCAANRLFVHRPSRPLRSPSAMNSFEINKILGAVLGTCLFLLAVHIASGAIFTPATPAKPGYEIAVKEEQPTAGGGAAAPAKEVPIAQLLASASPQQGEQRKSLPDLPQYGQGPGQQGRP